MSHLLSTQRAPEQRAPGRARQAAGHGAVLRAASSCSAPALRLDRFSYAYRGEERWTLDDVSLSIATGACHCLTGPTGSGKTTLALAARGLLPSGPMQGTIDVAGSSQANVGLVLESPETQIITDTVGAEVAFGLENRCVAPHAMRTKVTAALAAVGLDKPLEFPAAHLSMGQKYRLLVAAQWVLDPRVLILDEPVAQLDADGLDSLACIIEELKRRGVAVLLCEDNPGPLARVIDGYWQFTGNGAVLPGRSAPGEAAAVAPLPPPRVRSSDPAVRARGLSLHARDATPAWHDASLSLSAGDRVALCARNGEGKTSLLRCLAGFISPAAGQIEVLGARPSPERLRGRVGYLAQNPERQLFENTVFEEVSFPLRRLGVPRGELRDKVGSMLERCGIADLAERSPYRLSYGQKRLVALASIMACAPRLLLLDDPFAGLDAGHSRVVADVLVELSERHGTAVLWTSHDGCATRQWAHTVLAVEGGTLVAAQA